MSNNVSQNVSQTGIPRRSVDDVADIHSGLDISTPVSESPLYNIPMHNIQWVLPFPEDLTYYIVQTYFRSDLQSLRALASSCRCLSILCRPLSFRIVTIPPFVHDITPQARKFALIIKQCPEIISFIQDLRILDMRDLAYGAPNAQSPANKLLSREYCRSLVGICTKPFPALKSCRLDTHISWHTLPRSVAAAFEKLLTTPTLKNLGYMSASFPLSVIRLHFKNLQSLVLHACSPVTHLPRYTATSDQGAGKSKISLQHLCYKDLSTPQMDLTQYLTEAIDFSTLESLHILLLHSTTIGRILTSQSLISLQELIIQLDVLLASGLSLFYLDLRPLHSLQRLQVNLSVTMNNRPFDCRIKCIASIIQSSPTSIVNMGMKIKEIDPINTSELNDAWEALDVLFTDNFLERWPHLKVLDVLYFDCTNDDNAVAGLRVQVHPSDIRRSLPLLDASGILKVEVTREVSMYPSLGHSADRFTEYD